MVALRAASMELQMAANSAGKSAVESDFQMVVPKAVVKAASLVD